MRTNSTMKFYKVAFALVDLLLVNGAFALAFLFKFGLDIPDYNFDSYSKIFPWLSIGAFIIFYMFDLYSNWRRKSLDELIYSIVLALLTFSLFTMALTFWYRGFSFPRTVILLATVLQMAFFIGMRSFIWWVAKRKYGRRKVLIIDETLESGVAFAEKFFHHTKGWFIVHDFLPVAAWKTFMDRVQAVDVVLLGPSLNREQQAEIISHSSKCGKEVLIVPKLLDLYLLESEPQQIDDMLVLSIQPPSLHPAQLFVKRTFDLVVSSLLIILLLPVMLVLYFLIPLTSEGPAIFRQERLGRDGQPYLIYKFRSMVQNAEKTTGPVLASDHDPRITPIGRLIRATRLDEIPQLFNVLKGNMSLVGPRPERAFFIEQFQRSIPDYTYRMSVKPGITGLAQVMAKYSTTVEDKLRFDLMYVRNYSFGLDMKILLQTIRVVLQREQARGVAAENHGQREEVRRLLGYSEAASTQEKK